MLSPNIMTVIRENELLYLADLEDEVSHKPFAQQCQSFFDRSVPTICTSDQNLSDQPIPPLTGVIISSQSSQSTSISNQTDIIGEQELEAELGLWSEVSAERHRIKNSIIPPVHELKPFSDITRGYLKYLPCYYGALQYLARIWNRHVNTIVCPKVSCRLDREPFSNDARFLIIPTETMSGDDSLIIIDQSERQWIYLKPDNEACKDASYFEEIIRRYLLGLFPELADYHGWPVIIIGSFHKSYPRVHLLMSVYTISRLFRYSVALPRKVIYGEWEFRRYSSNICSTLQVVNAQYNIKQGLYAGGNLKPGAMISYPSPLEVVVAVVPKDQCMFCKRRGFKKLGSHYSMQHGGKAKIANESRLRFD